jgi:hypothetical protein
LLQKKKNKTKQTNKQNQTKQNKQTNKTKQKNKTKTKQTKQNKKQNKVKQKNKTKQAIVCGRRWWVYSKVATLSASETPWDLQTEQVFGLITVTTDIRSDEIDFAHLQDVFLPRQPPHDLVNTLQGSYRMTDPEYVHMMNDVWYHCQVSSSIGSVVPSAFPNTLGLQRLSITSCRPPV